MTRNCAVYFQGNTMVPPSIPESPAGAALSEEHPAERELANVRRELREAHDALVAAERAITTLLRHSHQREKANERHRRLKDAGSCQTCGAEAQANRSRCLDCGRKAAAYARRRAG